MAPALAKHGARKYEMENRRGSELAGYADTRGWQLCGWALLSAHDIGRSRVCQHEHKHTPYNRTTSTSILQCRQRRQADGLTNCGLLRTDYSVPTADCGLQTAATEATRQNTTLLGVKCWIWRTGLHGRLLCPRDSHIGAGGRTVAEWHLNRQGCRKTAADLPVFFWRMTASACALGQNTQDASAFCPVLFRTAGIALTHSPVGGGHGTQTTGIVGKRGEREGEMNESRSELAGPQAEHRLLPRQQPRDSVMQQRAGLVDVLGDLDALTTPRNFATTNRLPLSQTFTVMYVPLGETDLLPDLQRPLAAALALALSASTSRPRL